jgi:hypothetical protein
VVETRTENKNPRLLLFLYWAQPIWPTNKQARGLSKLQRFSVGHPPWCSDWWAEDVTSLPPKSGPTVWIAVLGTDAAFSHPTSVTMHQVPVEKLLHLLFNLTWGFELG